MFLFILQFSFHFWPLYKIWKSKADAHECGKFPERDKKLNKVVEIKKFCFDVIGRELEEGHTKMFEIKKRKIWEI